MPFSARAPQYLVPSVGAAGRPSAAAELVENEAEASFWQWAPGCACRISAAGARAGTPRTLAVISDGDRMRAG